MNARMTKDISQTRLKNTQILVKLLESVDNSIGGLQCAVFPVIRIPRSYQMQAFTWIKGWARELMDIMLLFIGLGVLVQIIFGSNNVGFFAGITSNLMGFVSQIGSGGFVGLIALLVIIGVFTKRNATT